MNDNPNISYNNIGVPPYTPINKPEPNPDKPSAEENKQLRRYYFRVSLIVLALTAVFSGMNYLMTYICEGILGGGFTKECIEAGKLALKASPYLSAIHSYFFPIAADIAALGIGLMVTDFRLSEKLKFKGFTGKEFCGFTACSFTAATIGSVIMLIIVTIATIIQCNSSELIDVGKVTQIGFTEEGNPLWLDIAIYTYVCFLGPILEELIFRGVLLTGLGKYGYRFGIIMSSVLFGLMHQNIYQCIPAICLGIVFASMTIRTGSLIPAIIVHIINNTMSSVMLLVMENINMNDLAVDILRGDSAALSMLFVSLGFFIFRIVCIIGAIVVLVKYFGAHGRLIGSDEYTRRRTWKYYFTSFSWLLVTGYLVVETIRSLVI